MTLPGGPSVLRRSQNQRNVDGMPTLKPIRVPSRLGIGSRPGSAGSTPRYGTPKMGKHKRWRLLYGLQLLLLVSLGALVVKQVSSFESSGSSGSSAPVRKRQLISSHGDDEWVGVQQASASKKEDRSQRLQELAEALLAENANPEVNMHSGDSLVSEVYVHPTTGPSGRKTSYFYRFTNVRFSDGGIDVFSGSERTQPQESIFDLALSWGQNTTAVGPPTSLALEGTGAKGSSRRRSIPVRYLAQQRPATACSHWVEEPALLVHTIDPDDMWHTWTTGLIPAFQTLRELGYLPLMEISPEGTIREVTGGIPTNRCPRLAATTSGEAAIQASECQLHAVLDEGAPKSCEVGNQTWCIPGVWHHTALNPAKRPSIVFFDEKVVDNEWGSVYSAMASSVRSFDASQGLCFRNAIVGTTHTLSVDESLPSGGEGGEPKERLDRMAAALEVFGCFVRRTQHLLKVNNAIEFLGYSDFYPERLRKGVDFGKSNVIDHSFEEPLAVAAGGGATGSLMEDWEELKQQPWMFNATRSSLTPKRSIPFVAEQAAEQLQLSPIGRPAGWALETPLPVVTYISRWNDLDRAVLNERQVLRYIYWKYNATIRVTTLSEHVDAVADLFARTDVLIGMHGPGWAHAMFLKPGAASLQLFPYGWRLTDGGLLRGGFVRTLVQLRRGTHLDWVNPHASFTYFRRQDFADDPEDFRRHPEVDVDSSNGASSSQGGEWTMPRSDTTTTAPHPAWLHANTYADLNHLGPYIDEVMRAAGVPEMNPETLAVVREEKIKIQREKMERRRKEAERAELGIEIVTEENGRGGVGSEEDSTTAAADVAETVAAEAKAEKDPFGEGFRWKPSPDEGTFDDIAARVDDAFAATIPDDEDLELDEYFKR